MVKKEFSAAGLQEASEKLDKLKMSKEELAAYEKFLMDRQSIDSAIRTAVVENNMKIAKEMKSDGMPIEKISKFTGLSEEEIQCL